jgi:hypothetical protein
VACEDERHVAAEGAGAFDRIGDRQKRSNQDRITAAGRVGDAVGKIGGELLKRRGVGGQVLDELEVSHKLSVVHGAGPCSAMVGRERARR